MNYENLNIQWKGFRASKSFDRLIKRVAEEAHWSAPSDSYLRIICEKGKDAVKSSCRIASQAGVFMVEVSADTPEMSLKKLEAKIRQTLLRWKQTRFSLLSGDLEKAS